MRLEACDGLPLVALVEAVPITEGNQPEARVHSGAEQKEVPAEGRESAGGEYDGLGAYG
jgi:hypothetical protein